MTDLNPMPSLLVIDLLTRGGEAFLKDIEEPSYKTIHRKELKEHGLLEETKKLRTEADGTIRKQPVICLTLTDAGWCWAERNMGTLALPPKSKKCTQVLARLANVLEALMKRKGLVISDVFAEPNGDNGITNGQVSPGRKEPTAKEFLRLLRDNYHELRTDGGGLRIMDIKDRFHEVPNDVIDRLLIELQRAGILVLYSLVVPPPEPVKKAATLVAGEPRHMAYFT
jgi:hypothetical protein